MTTKKLSEMLQKLLKDDDENWSVYSNLYYCYLKHESKDFCIMNVKYSNNSTKVFLYDYTTDEKEVLFDDDNLNAKIIKLIDERMEKAIALKKQKKIESLIQKLKF